jgi:putative tryptophan/tyrosine transport system substrate-binding protein
MRRRELITLLGSGAICVCSSFAISHAQQAKLPVIGFLGSSTPAGQAHLLTAYMQRLRELGWVEGRNLSLEQRWAEGRDDLYEEIADEFVRRKVDIVLTHGSRAALAAKKATSTIPIVAAVIGDPVGSGLVASLARPGGNLTGLSLISPDLAGKRVELLYEAVPSSRRLAVLADVGNRASDEETQQAQLAATKLGRTAFPISIRRSEDITSAFDGIEDRADALYVVGSPTVLANSVRVNILAAAARIPTVYIAKEYVQTGGLLAYGPSFANIYRRAAEFSDKILRGATPSDIPVEQPTKFDLVINLTTAKALRITIPPMLLARADEVIE